MSEQKEKVIDDSAESQTGGSIDLDTAIEKIRRKLSSTERHDVLGRYQVALQIRAVRDGAGNRYGDGAMKKLAKQIGYSEETLRLYAQVPDAWDEEAFKKLASRKNPRNMPARWTVFLFIAGRSSEEERGKCQEMFFAEGLSSEAIKRSLHSPEVAADANDAAEESTAEDGFSEAETAAPSETEEETSSDSDSESSAETAPAAAKAALKSSDATPKTKLRSAIGVLQGISGQVQNVLSFIAQPLKKAHKQSLEKRLREQFAEARDQLRSNAEAFATLAQKLTEFLDEAGSAEAQEQSESEAEEEPALQEELEASVT